MSSLLLDCSGTNRVPLRVRGLAFLIERCGVQLEKWPADSILRLGRRVAEPLPRWALNYYIERHSEWYGNQLHSEWYGDQLEKWPVERLLRLASWIAEPLPLGWCPGWHYDFRDWNVDDRANHLGRLRWWLWHHFASIREEYSFAIPWYRGLKIWLYPGNDTSWAMFVGRGYEPNEFAYLATTLRSGMTFVDIGANEGLHTLFAFRCVGPKGKVIAIESNSRACCRLSRNLKLNRAQNVLTFPLGASGERGEAITRVAGYADREGLTRWAGPSFLMPSLARLERERPVPVDDVVDEAKIDRVDMIRINVAGAEAASFREARNTLNRDRPILLLQLNDRTLNHQGAGRGELLRRGGAIDRSGAIAGHEVFLGDEARDINDARLRHLDSLGLDIRGKRVLEVGAGIGLHTEFFEQLSCAVLCTDGREENVQEIRRRYPHRNVRVLDLDAPFPLEDIGVFDVVYCYGTLYHLQRPEEAICHLASVCRELFLLETIVTPAPGSSLEFVAENAGTLNQALGGKGCRPTRQWVMERLRKYLGYAYITKTQPLHPEFHLDWSRPTPGKHHRAIFVASRKPLDNHRLSDSLLECQTYEVLRVLQEHGYQILIFDPASGRPVAGETPPEEDRNIIAVPLS